MKFFVIGGMVAREGEGVTKEADLLRRACYQLGKSLAEARCELLVCSPFEDAADVQVLRGVAASEMGRNTRIEFHFPDASLVREQLDRIIAELRLTNVSKVPHPPSQVDETSARRYAWLLCQLSALEISHATIGIGGDPNGAANMLFQLADGKRKPLLPLPILGGAAQQAFERRRYELVDRLGVDLASLDDDKLIGQAIGYAVILAEEGIASGKVQQEAPSFFISYARARQAEADFVETLLRRRNLRVFRDESDFGAGYAIPIAIREAIFGATVFIALWSAEYACSPWCFDELELALDRHANGMIDLWLLRVDSTRVVPTRARELAYFDTPSRELLEGKVLGLLALMRPR